MTQQDPGNQAEQIAQLTQRVFALEQRIPNSKIISPSFWQRAWTVFGYYLATALVLNAIILGVIIIFGGLAMLVGLAGR